MLVPGTQIQHWKVVRHIGSQRNGSLYVVERAGRNSVLKWMAGSEASPLAESLEALAAREVLCLQRLQGPQFTHLEAHGRWPETEHGIPFLILQAIPGMHLPRWANVRGATAPETALLLVEITRSVVDMHDRNVRYPSLLSRDFWMRNGELSPVLIDLGGAVPLSRPLTRAEMAEDIHAIGEMFYCLVTGQSPGPDSPPPHLINPHVPELLSYAIMSVLSMGEPWPSELLL
jgi:hypothetical protein